MNINSMLLRILFVFLIIIEEVFGKSCYLTNFNMDKCLSPAIIECLENSPVILTDKLPSTHECATAIYTFEDGKKLRIATASDTSSPQKDICENDMASLKDTIEKRSGKKVKDFKCTKCPEDRCNGEEEQKEKEKEKEKEKKNEGLRCYQSELEPSCMDSSDMKSLMSCYSRAKIKEKGHCERCTLTIYTNSDNEKITVALCNGDNECPKNEELQQATHNLVKSAICVSCKYDLCNDLEKQGLTKNEAGNQVVSNPTVIIFISMLVCLMF